MEELVLGGRQLVHPPGTSAPCLWPDQADSELSLPGDHKSGRDFLKLQTVQFFSFMHVEHLNLN